MTYNTFTAGTVAESAKINENFKYSDVYGGNTGLIKGCDITQKVSPGLTADLAAGVVQINGMHYSISGQTITFASANATLPRFDLVSVGASGTATVTTGTAAALPAMPAVPANELALAYVYRAAADNTITTNTVLKSHLKANDSGLSLLYSINDYAARSLRIPMPAGLTYKYVKVAMWGHVDDGNSTASIKLTVNDITGAYYAYQNIDDSGTITDVTGASNFPLFDNTDDAIFGGEIILSYDAVADAILIVNNVGHNVANRDKATYGICDGTTVGLISSFTLSALSGTSTINAISLRVYVEV